MGNPRANFPREFPPGMLRVPGVPPARPAAPHPSAASSPPFLIFFASFLAVTLSQRGPRGSRSARRCEQHLARLIPG